MSLLEDQVRDLLQVTATSADLPTMSVDSVVGQGDQVIRRRRTTRMRIAAVVVAALAGGGTWATSAHRATGYQPAGTVNSMDVVAPARFGPVHVEEAAYAESPQLGPYDVRYGFSAGIGGTNYVVDFGAAGRVEWSGADLSSGTLHKWLNPNTLVTLVPSHTEANVVTTFNGNLTTATRDLPSIDAKVIVQAYQLQQRSDTRVDVVWRDAPGAVRSSDPGALRTVHLTNTTGRQLDFWWINGSNSACGVFASDAFSVAGACSPPGPYVPAYRYYDEQSGRTTWLVQVPAADARAARFVPDQTKPAVSYPARAVHQAGGESWAEFEVPTRQIGHVGSLVTWPGGSQLVE